MSISKIKPSYGLRIDALTERLAGDFHETASELIREHNKTSDYDGQAHLFASRDLTKVFHKAGFTHVREDTVYKLLCELFNPEWNPFR
jgi:hypothetical protein